ncbi:hypothetical protein Ciccas_005315, partial [Cichlidogyrus casuarinus]
RVQNMELQMLQCDWCTGPGDHTKAATGNVGSQNLNVRMKSLGACLLLCLHLAQASIMRPQEPFPNTLQKPDLPEEEEFTFNSNTTTMLPVEEAEFEAITSTTTTEEPTTEKVLESSPTTPEEPTMARVLEELVKANESSTTTTEEPTTVPKLEDLFEPNETSTTTAEEPTTVPKLEDPVEPNETSTTTAEEPTTVPKLEDPVEPNETSTTTAEEPTMARVLEELVKADESSTTTTTTTTTGVPIEVNLSSYCNFDPVKDDLEPVIAGQICYAQEEYSIVLCTVLLTLLVFCFAKNISVYGCKKLFDYRLMGTSHPMRPELLVIMGSTLPTIVCTLARPIARKLSNNQQRYYEQLVLGMYLAQTRIFLDFFVRSACVYHMIFWVFRMPIINLLWHIYMPTKLKIIAFKEREKNDTIIMKQPLHGRSRSGHGGRRRKKPATPAGKLTRGGTSAAMPAPVSTEKRLRLTRPERAGAGPKVKKPAGKKPRKRHVRKAKPKTPAQPNYFEMAQPKPMTKLEKAMDMVPILKKRRLQRQQEAQTMLNLSMFGPYAPQIVSHAQAQGIDVNALISALLGQAAPNGSDNFQWSPKDLRCPQWKLRFHFGHLRSFGLHFHGKLQDQNKGIEPYWVLQDMSNDPFGLGEGTGDNADLHLDDEVKRLPPPTKEFIIICKRVIPAIIYFSAFISSIPVCTGFDVKESMRFPGLNLAVYKKPQGGYFYYDMLMLVGLPTLLTMFAFYYGAFAKKQMNGEEKMYYRLKCYYVVFMLFNVQLLVLMFCEVFMTKETDHQTKRKWGNWSIIILAVYHMNFIIKSTTYATGFNMICCSANCLKRHPRLKGWIYHMTTPIITKEKEKAGRLFEAERAASAANQQNTMKLGLK